MLDYRTPKLKYEESPEELSWRLRRLAYYAAHLLLFALIVYRPGPNIFLFHSPFSPTPADYAALTPEFEPTVAAIKVYQRDHGKLPHTSYELPRRYKPAPQQERFGSIVGFSTITFQVDTVNVLEYDFRPATEGWIIYAPRYHGRIPAPIVPAAPTPATRPTTTPSTNDPN